MAFSNFIKKSLSRKRGYKYRTYKTEIEKNIFKLYHCYKKILEIDLKKKEILYYYIYSNSDKNAIDMTLMILDIDAFTYKKHIFKTINYKNLTFYIRLEDLKYLNKVKTFFSQFDKKTLEKINNLSFNSLINLVEKIINNKIDKNYVYKILKLSKNIREAFKKKDELLSKTIVYLKNAVLINKDYSKKLVLFYLDDKVYKTNETKIKNFVLEFNKKYFHVVNNISNEDLKYIKQIKHPFKESILNNILISKL